LQGGDSTDEDLMKVKEEVDQLKQQLHGALIDMEEELVSLYIL